MVSLSHPVPPYRCGPRCSRPERHRRRQRQPQPGLIQKGWERRLPNNATPVNSTVVAFTRQGHPRTIQGWKDLDNKELDNVLANPKTSGHTRWNDEGLPKDAREATETDGKRRKGDVLLNWETEAILAKRTGEWITIDKVFSPNVLTEMPAAVVDRTVDKKGTRKVAEAFARFLYTPAAQKAFTGNGFHPVTAEGKAYARGRFPQVTFFRIGDLGGWPSFDRTHVGKGGVWDQIFSQTRSL